MSTLIKHSSFLVAGKIGQLDEVATRLLAHCISKPQPDPDVVVHYANRITELVRETKEAMQAALADREQR